MNALSKIVFVGLCMVLVLPAMAQRDRKSQLQERKTQLQDEIEFVNKILVETRKSEQNSMGALQALVQKIRMRQELIRTIDREIRIINSEISMLQSEVDSMEKTTAMLKQEYAEMIRQSYKQTNNRSELLFVLSSSDFDQAVKRITYLKQLAEHRERQVAEIKARQEALEAKIEELEKRKQEQESLKTNKVGERKNLENEKQEQQVVVNTLKQKESDLIKQIRAKQNEADKLESEIQRLIADELRKAREKAAREALEKEAKEVGLVPGKDFTARTESKRLQQMIAEKRKALNLAEKPAAPAAPTYNLTPEARQLAANFAANRGTLPWPVARGVIVAKFGKQPHPVAKGILVNNPHIEIATEKGAKARATFDGEVTNVFRIPGANKTVIIRHGNYFTVYSNLIEVTVEKGDKVHIKQEIGTIYTDKENQTVLQFGLWLDDKIQNPEPWLVR